MHQSLDELLALVFPEGDNQPIGAGCSGSSVAEQPSLCLSTNPPDMANATQSPTGQPQTAAGGPLLARLWFPGLYRLLNGEPWALPKRRDLLSQLEGRI